MSEDGLVDWHSHLLPGLDDGATSLEEALEIAHLLVSAGFRNVCCTPHRLHGLYDLSSDQIRQAVAELQRHLERQRIPLTLHAGSEYYVDEFFVDELNDPLPLGESRYLLLEIPSQGETSMILGALQQVRGRGLIPLLAHPERAPLLTRTLPLTDTSKNSGISFWRRAAKGDAGRASLPSLLVEMTQLGVKFQGNIGSFSGYYGEKVRLAAQTLASHGIYHCYGSDAHRLTSLQRYLNSGMAIYHRQELGRDATPLG
ncbi:MAG: hypothetical protein C0621_03475 [Desulfuromonas sp.]|nr:MAG: hypothetical protein C0621_03475 [Desulfuromonas sp.]